MSASRWSRGARCAAWGVLLVACSEPPAAPRLDATRDLDEPDRGAEAASDLGADVLDASVADAPDVAPDVAPAPDIAPDIAPAPDVTEGRDASDVPDTIDVPDVPDVPDVLDVLDVASPLDVRDAVDAPSLDSGEDPLVLWLRFDESSGPVIDSSSSGLRGSVTGAGVTRGVAGVHGGAVQFAGGDGRVVFPTSPRIDLPGASTVEAWLRADVAPPDIGYVFSRGSTLSDGVTWILSAVGFSVSYSRAVTFPLTVDSGPSYLATAVWTHVAVVNDGVALRLYRDGSLTHESLGGRGSVILSDLVLGGERTRRPFRGSIDDMRWWRAALTPEQVCVAADRRWVAGRCEVPLMDGGTADAPADRPAADRPDAPPVDVAAARTLSAREVELTTGLAHTAWLGAGDFNGDAHQDIVLLDADAPGLLLLRGVGAGAFAAPARVALPSLAYTAASADFDEDGLLDLALMVPAPDGVLLAFGDRARGLRVGARIVGSGHRPAAGDFDGDGHADLALVSASDTLSALFLRGRGNGGFNDPVATRLTPTPMSPGAGNLDGVGGDELLVAQPTAPGARFASLRAGADGRLTTVTTTALPSYGSFLPPLLGDLDADGALDVLMTRSGATPNYLLPGRGSTTAPAMSLGIAGGVVGCLADLDGDGRTDVVTEGLNAIGLVRSLGSGVFASAFSVRVSLPVSAPLTCRDMNADGRPDVIAWYSSISRISLMLNTSR